MVPAIERAAAIAGVTRLADVTGLDRIGLPTWQAIRPMSKALSVHQGKGACHADARAGAVLEGLESHFAEEYSGPSFQSTYAGLQPQIRPPDMSDFCKSRDVAIDVDGALEWVTAARVDGGHVAVPLIATSMDYSRWLGTPFDRTSTGVAVGTSRDEAMRSALLEIVERDAVVEWLAAPLVDRMSDQISPRSVPFDWFRYWRDRVESLGAYFRCYRVPSFTGIPVIACELGDVGKRATPFQAIVGQCAHPDPEIALFRAMAEAFQGRTAYVAGSRDDLLPSQYCRRPQHARIGFAMPLPPGETGIDFTSIMPEADPFEAIASARHGPVAAIDLGKTPDFFVVRMFALGLGSTRRRRRS